MGFDQEPGRDLGIKKHQNSQIKKNYSIEIKIERKLNCRILCLHTAIVPHTHVKTAVVPLCV
jgi:hypothetical protein